MGNNVLACTSYTGHHLMSGALAPNRSGLAVTGMWVAVYSAYATIYWGVTMLQAVIGSLVVAAIIAFAAALRSGPIWSAYIGWRRRHAFNVTVDNDYMPEHPRDLEAIPIGSQLHYIVRVTPWKRVSIEHLNVRLVPSETIRRDAHRVPGATAHIKQWSFIPRGDEPVPKCTFSDDHRGGITGVPSEPITCTADKDLILNVQIVAERSWYGGYLSVRADIGEDKTYFGRAPAQTAR